MSRVERCPGASRRRRTWFPATRGPPSQRAGDRLRDGGLDARRREPRVLAMISIAPAKTPWRSLSWPRPLTPPAQWRRFAPWPNPARSSAFATRGVATGRATWTSTTGAKQPRLDDVAASPELSGSSSATAPARVLRFCLPASAIWQASIRADLGQDRIARDVRACRALQDASDCSATCSSARKSGSGATRAKIRRPPGASLAGGSLAGGTLPPHAQSQSVH
jgi:hypothetical protein